MRNKKAQLRRSERLVEQDHIIYQNPVGVQHQMISEQNDEWSVATKLIVAQAMTKKIN